MMLTELDRAVMNVRQQRRARLAKHELTPRVRENLVALAQARDWQGKPVVFKPESPEYLRGEEAKAIDAWKLERKDWTRLDLMNALFIPPVNPVYAFLMTAAAQARMLFAAAGIFAITFVTSLAFVPRIARD